MKAGEGEDIDLVDLILVLWSQKLLIAGFALIFGALAAVFGLTRPVTYELRVPIDVKVDLLGIDAQTLLRPIGFAVGPSWQVTADKASTIAFFATSSISDPSVVEARVAELAADVEAFEKEWVEVAKLRMQYFSTDLPEGLRDADTVASVFLFWLDRVKLYEAGVDLFATLEPGSSGFGGVSRRGTSYGPVVAGGAVAGFLLGCFVALFGSAVRSRRKSAAI